MHTAATQFPDKPGVNGAEHELALLSHPSGIRYIVQEPLEFAPRKISVQHQARPLPEQGLFAQLSKLIELQTLQTWD